jgi:hypothetical protein
MNDFGLLAIKDAQYVPQAGEIPVPGDFPRKRSNLDGQDIFFCRQIFHAAFAAGNLAGEQERTIPALAEGVGHQDGLNRRTANIQARNYARDGGALGVHFEKLD